MNAYTLTNKRTNRTVTVLAQDVYRAKIQASALHHVEYPDVKGSPNSPFHWSVSA